MRVFKTRFMARFCKAEGINDKLLADAVARAERGLIDATLGDGLIKQRVARPGKGKSGGWRTLIAYRSGRRAVFLFGFAKSDLDNISAADLASLKISGRGILTATDRLIEVEIDHKRLLEIPYGEKD